MKKKKNHRKQNYPLESKSINLRSSIRRIQINGGQTMSTKRDGMKKLQKKRNSSAKEDIMKVFDD
jgi:hypothetical protein